MAFELAESKILIFFAVSHVSAILLTVGLVAYVVRNYWDKTIGRAFVFMVASTSIWVVGSFARTVTRSVDAFIAVSAFKYVGITTAPVAVFVFALLYDGRDQWVTRRAVASLLALPSLTVVVVATMNLHRLFYSSYATTTVGPLSVIVVTDVGPWYWANVVYSWGLLAVGSTLLVYAAIKKARFYLAQFFVLLVAVLASWVGNLVYVFFSWPHPAIDPTPIGFAVTSLLLGIGIFSNRIVDVTPAARSKVLDTIDDAVIVLDRGDRVIDRNDAAKPLFVRDAPIGGSAREVLPSELVRAPTSDPVTVELELDSQTRYYHYRRFSIGPTDASGTVLVLTDVTTATRRRQRIERLNDELETLNRILRHDVRNEITVISRLRHSLEPHVDEDGEETLERIGDHEDNIADLTTSLRDLMRTMLDEKRTLRPMQVGTVLEAEIEALRTATEDASVTVEGDLSRSNVRANDMLSTLFRNLLRNAVQHNDTATPEITVSTRDTATHVEVRIADDGPGIPDELEETIFGKGEKGLESKGTGIGLYLVAVLADEYDGDVWVEDNQPRGSVFVVELPKSTSASTVPYH